MKRLFFNARAYDRIAEQWDENRKNKGIDPCIITLSEILPSHGKILDIGCGTGYPIDQYLDQKGFFITGIDPSEKMLQKARQLNLKHAVFRSIGLFAFKTEETFDAIIAFDSLFHIALRHQEKIYAKISSLLKPQGLFLFTHGKETGTVYGSMFGERFRYSSLNIDLVKTLLETADLEILRCYENYEAPITGSRDLLILTKKRG